MKKVSTLFLAIVSIFAFSSCDNAELGPVMSTTPGAPSITSPQPGESYVLTEEAAEDTLLTIRWTEPDYGFPTATSFVVEMGKTGADFAEPVEIGTTTKTSYSVTVAGMNNRLLAAGYPFGQEAALELRVVASISDSVSTNVSEAIPLSFTPYEVVIVYPEIYVPGSYQAVSGYTANWSPADAPALTSAESNGQYEGYVYIDANDPDKQFKFTDERSWDLNWGDNGADGTIEQNGANIVAPDAGYYKMNVNLNTMTYSILNTTWGVIGSATAGGWDSDQDMTYDPTAKVWTITTNLTAGDIKFRANDAWDLNYGDDGMDGKLEAGAGNIAVDEAGNYTITLNLSEYPYTYTLTKN